MKQRLKTHQLILLGVLIALVFACGAVYAYMFMRTGEQSTQFVPATVDCAVTNSDTVVVQNTGNIDAYIRVRLVSYWVDGEDNIAAKSSVMPSVDYDTEFWVEGADNTYYYKAPVGPDVAVSLLKTPIDLKTEDGYSQVVDVFAEAIQADPSNAVAEAWGVTVDASGNLALPTP